MTCIYVGVAVATAALCPRDATVSVDQSVFYAETLRSFDNLDPPVVAVEDPLRNMEHSHYFIYCHGHFSSDVHCSQM